MNIGYMTLDVIVRAKDGSFESIVGEVQVPLTVNLAGLDGTGFAEATITTEPEEGTDPEPEEGTT